MTRPTILDSENVALLDLTPSGRAKPAWAAAAEKVVAQQMASLTASVIRHAGDDDTTAWDDVRRYVEGLERENATAYELIGKTVLEPYVALKDRAEAAEARIAELEAALDEKEVAAGLTSNGNLWRFWSTKASALAVRNAELEKRLADAERVIEPFAAVEPMNVWHETEEDEGYHSLTENQFRAARAYMEGK